MGRLGKKRINMYIPENLYKDLKEMARDYNISMTRIIIRTIKKRLIEHKIRNS